MGRYTERYWDNRPSFGEEVVGTIFTAGLINALDDPPLGYGCEITDEKLGLVGTTHELKPSKAHAHDAAWNDLEEKKNEYYEGLRYEREIARKPKTDDGGSDLAALLIKWGVYLALIIGAIWLALAVVLPLIIINCAVISFIIGVSIRKNKNYLYILSLLGTIFILVDYNKGLFTRALVENVHFFEGAIPFFLYLNISAGLIASYFLVRNVFDENKPPLEDDDEFSKRNLIIMASLLVVGVATVLVQRHFDSGRSFEPTANISNTTNLGNANAPSQNVPNSSVAGNNVPTSNNFYVNGHFTGAWFTVTVPADFSARPSMQSKSGSGYESAFFDSPGGDVEFYIFSPQWGGEPTDNNIDNNIEKITSIYHEGSKGLIKTWTEIQALDGSYFRAYQDTKVNNGTIHWIIGLKYKSKAAYEKYKPAYLSFKKSLKQFSD